MKFLKIEIQGTWHAGINCHIPLSLNSDAQLIKLITLEDQEPLIVEELEE